MANTFKFGNGEWAVGKETVLAYNDENNNFKPLPFTFDRGSIATVVNKEGLIETVGIDEPRIDFLNNTKGHLLLEPSRQNVITYSEEFDNAYWLKVGGAVTANYAISPDGTQNADRFFLATAASNTRIYINYTFSAASYTMSVYAKKNGTTTSFRFSYADDGGQSFSPDFQLTDEWQRFTYSFTSVGGSGALWIANTSSSGVGFELDIILFGAQLEVGSYATSYIPTSGSAVTRSAETSSADIPTSAAGQSEGTLYFEMNFMNDANEYPSVFLWSGSSLDRVLIQRRGNNKLLQAQLSRTGQTTISLLGTSTISDGVHKMAFAYSTTRLVGYVDGVKFAEETGSFTTFTNQLNKVDLIYNTSQADIRDLKLYNTALTDAELIALTT